MIYILVNFIWISEVRDVMKSFSNLFPGLFSLTWGQDGHWEQGDSFYSSPRGSLIGGLYVILALQHMKHQSWMHDYWKLDFCEKENKDNDKNKKNKANIFKTSLIYIVRCLSLLGSGFSPLFSSFHSHWCCYLMKACWSCQWRELSISSWQCLCSLRQSRDTE